ncbi:MAG TPA: asparagine synthase (glutamine-hydrolyzing), partial [Desulfobaccales bacterium]
MCGILGLAGQVPREGRELLGAMGATLGHRGPDDAGEWWSPEGDVGLGHRRLAVIDLSPGGHQPMADASGQFVIVYNGEIYNFQDLRRELTARGHRFRTASDTEVILEAYRAWGLDCLRHFNGMFAFALYDRGRRRLFLARDRAGEKPLYFRRTPASFCFASELKALMADPACPRRLDLEALNFYLAYGYVPGDRCILQGVEKLPPAMGLTYELATGQLRQWRYWDLPEPDPGKRADPEQLAQEAATLLKDSVRLRLIADVPVGILLSGGLDSSLVTAMAAQVATGRVRTFTIAFPGHGALDEGPYARLVAKHWGTEHTELVAERASVALLPELARQYDEPLGDHALVPTYLVTRLIRQHATVALGGDGGDELFGGYHHYNFLQRHAGLRRCLPGPLRGLVAGAAARFLPLGFKGRHHFMGLSGDPAWGIAHVNLFFDARSRRRLTPLLRDAAEEAVLLPETSRASLCRRDHSLLQQATRADFRTTLADGYLVKVDRASMLNSLEVRAPFLDHRLVEFAFGRLPDELRATAEARKVLLQRLAGRLLPPTFDAGRKQGFTMPLATWFTGEWGTFMEGVLAEADPRLLDPGMVRQLIAGQRRGYANIDRLFLLTMLELWRREYQV